MSGRFIVKTIGGTKKHLPGSSFAFRMSFTGQIGTDHDRKMVILVMKSDRNDLRVKLRFTDLSRNVSGMFYLPASVRDQLDWAPYIMAVYANHAYNQYAPILNAQLIYDQFIESSKQ